MKLLIAVFLISSCIFSISAQNSAKCDPQDSLFGNKCYRFVNQLLNFTSAVDYCRGIGYSLTSIHSMFENNFLRQQSENIFDKTYDNFYIGLYSPSKNTDNWVFVDGSVYDFNNWNNGEPSGSRWYVAFRVADGKWITVSTSASIPFVCSAASNNTSPASTTVAPMTTTFLRNACFACPQPRPKILQPGDSGAKCTNATILGGYSYPNQVNKNTCSYYAACHKSGSIVAHFTDNGKSSCLAGLDIMYFLCINSTWMVEFRGNYYPGVDQLYCYESDENSCSKCPEPIQPLQPGNEAKCDNDHETITSSTLKNITDDDGVCTWKVLCSYSSYGTWTHLNDTIPESCIYDPYGASYKCFNGKWAISACDDEFHQLYSYHEIDEIYCAGRKTTTALTTKGMTKL